MPRSVGSQQPRDVFRRESFQRLLQPFTQGDMGSSRPAGGLGLGLAVARAIVDAHGGELHLGGNESRGTTVRVRLPLAGTCSVRPTTDT